MEARKDRDVRRQDRLHSGDVAEGEVVLDVTPLLGTWVNTNSASRGIEKVILSTRGDALTVHTFGACDPAPHDWGESAAETTYADSIRSREGIAFTALYNFGFMTSHLQANINKGLLIIAGFHTFKADSGRSNYISREFFHPAASQ